MKRPKYHVDIAQTTNSTTVYQLMQLRTFLFWSWWSVLDYYPESERQAVYEHCDMLNERHGNHSHDFFLDLTVVVVLCCLLAIAIVRFKVVNS
jgi:hypothetical protein